LGYRFLLPCLEYMFHTLGNLSVHIVFESRIQRISRITLVLVSFFDLGGKIVFWRIILFQGITWMSSGKMVLGFKFHSFWIIFLKILSWFKYLYKYFVLVHWGITKLIQKQNQSNFQGRFNIISFIPIGKPGM